MFIITDYRIDLKRTFYVCAPPGYARSHLGTIFRGGTDPRKSDAEWSENRNHAYEFTTHRSAARVANVCLGKIVDLSH